MSRTVKHYLVDLGNEILALAREAQRNARRSNDNFDKGRQTALYEVLSLMKQQADVFGMDAASVGLKGIDIEELLN